jgi:transcriptional regulator with XRE-family HTH domain
MAGLSLAAVAAALGCSRQLVGSWEARRLIPDPIQLARWGAVVGLDIPIRSFAGGSPLRDAGQLRLLERLDSIISPKLKRRTEVAVSRDPRDRRTTDLVAATSAGRFGFEAISRFTDGQAQVRAALLKQEASGVDSMILVLADTRHNRRAIDEAAPTLRPSFPLGSRAVLRALRAGQIPRGNGVILI